MTRYLVTTVGTWRSVSDLRNVHAYDFPEYNPDETELQEFVDAFDSALKTRLQGNFPNEVAIVGYELRRGDIADQPTVLYIPTAGGWTGTVTASNPLPPQVSCMISFKATTTKPRTSRCYLFPFSTAALGDDGQVGPGAVTNATNYGNDILSIPITGQNNALKLAWSRGTGTTPMGSAANPLTTVSVNNRYKTQRRRREGVGS